MKTYCIECNQDVFETLLKNYPELGIKLKNDKNDKKDKGVFNIENKDNDSYTNVELCDLCYLIPCLNNFVDVDKIKNSLLESNKELFSNNNTNLPANLQFEPICSYFFRACPSCLIKSYTININNQSIPRCMLNCHCLNFNGINDYMYFFKYIFTYAKNNFLKDDKNKYKCNSCNAICVGITSFFNHTFNKCRNRNNKNIDMINKIRKNPDFKFKFPTSQCGECSLPYDYSCEKYHSNYECLKKCPTCPTSQNEFIGKHQYDIHRKHFSWHRIFI